MFRIAVEKNENLYKNFRARGFMGLAKRGLREMVVHWHAQYFQRHFTERAYGLYGRSVYPYRKPGPKKTITKKPLVETGHLREKMLARPRKAEIKGTAKGMRLQRRYGQPASVEEIARRRGYSSVDDWLHEVALRRVVSQGVSYRSAMREARKRLTGYSEKVKLGFQAKMTAVSENERRHLMHFTRDRIQRHMTRQAAKARWVKANR